MGMQSSCCSHKLIRVRILSIHHNLNWFIQLACNISYMQSPVWLFGFQFNALMAWWNATFSSTQGKYFTPCSFLHMLLMFFLITMLYNAYVGWFWTEEAIFGSYFEVWREWSSKQYPSLRTKHYRSNQKMDLPERIIIK